MTNTMMSTHKAFKALQRAGIDDQQAEAMVEIFTDMQQGQPPEQIGKQLGQFTTKVHQIDEWLEHVERKTDKLAIRLNQLEVKVDKLAGQHGDYLAGGNAARHADWYEADIQPLAGSNDHIDEQVVVQLAEEASRLLRGGEPLSVQSWKTGLKPIPGDGDPVQGELQKVPGCYVAFTHSGVTLALIVGELLAEEIVSGEKHPMLASFGAERFT